MHGKIAQIRERQQTHDTSDEQKKGKSQQRVRVRCAVKKVHVLGRNILETSKLWVSISLVKPFGLAGGISVRSKMDLNLVRKDFNCFNFYSIDR